MRCKYCKYYEYNKEVYLYAHTDSPSIGCGFCTHSCDVSGHRVFECDISCKYFQEQEKTFCIGDVLQNDTEIVFVRNINEKYYPKKYRVTNNYGTYYNVSAEELIKYKKIMNGVSEEISK